MLRCAILDDYQNVALSMTDWSPLSGRVETVVFNEHIADRHRLADVLSGFDIIVAMRERTPIDADLLARLPNLKLLITTGMRNASIDIAAANARGVPVCGTGAMPGSAAELTWGLILALLRHIPQESAGFRAKGPWQLTVGHGLAGRRLGIIGLGNLGRRVARVGLAFEMKVSGWSRSLTPDKAAALGIDHCASLDDLLAGSDVVTVHVTLNAQTRGLLGARELSQMKKTAFLINTSRGPIVDEAALVEALRGGQIAGAAVDVFDREPLPPDHPLRSLDTLVATPHLGYVTEETYRIYFREAVEDIEAFLAGAPVRVLAAKR
jgi:phosphoglycerate dehydrogenase-like enzyme